MTEFRKFSAALDDAKLTLQTAAATDNSDSATARRDAAEAIRRRCADGDLRRTADKFAAKLEATDDVTEPTFLATLQTARRVRDAAAARVHAEEEGAAADLTAAEEVVVALEAEAPLRTVQKPRYGATMRAKVAACVEINKCVGCMRSFLGDDAAVLARSSGEELASLRHRAGVASMAWRPTRRVSTNAS